MVLSFSLCNEAVIQYKTNTCFFRLLDNFWKILVLQEYQNHNDIVHAVFKLKKMSFSIFISRVYVIEWCYRSGKNRAAGFTPECGSAPRTSLTLEKEINDLTSRISRWIQKFSIIPEYTQVATEYNLKLLHMLSSHCLATFPQMRMAFFDPRI